MKKGKEREEILYFLVFQLEQINIYLPCTLIVIPFSIFQRRISRRNNASSKPNESNLGIHIYSKMSIKNSCFRRNSLERKRWKILQPFKLARLIPSHERFLAISFSREELPRLEFPIHAFLNKFFFPFIQSSSKKPRLNWVILLIWLTIIFLTNCWWSPESSKKMNYFIYSWQRFYSSLNLTVSFPGQNFHFRIEDKIRRDYPRKGIKDIQAVLEITTRKVERESNGADKRGRVTCNSGGVSR